MPQSIITSRKNSLVKHLKTLGSDGAYRRERGEFVALGDKMLSEALDAGVEVTSLLYRDERPSLLPGTLETFKAEADILSYVSGMKSPPEIVFSCALPDCNLSIKPGRYVVLENVQDPGNVGTILRSALAFSFDGVVLVGACADPFSPKAARASMGAVFRCRVIFNSLYELENGLKHSGIPLYGAVLNDEATALNNSIMTDSITFAVGNEGSGLSAGLLDLCACTVKIPMLNTTESLNASVAASILMWEHFRRFGKSI